MLHHGDIIVILHHGDIIVIVHHGDIIVILHHGDVIVYIIVTSGDIILQQWTLFFPGRPQVTLEMLRTSYTTMNFSEYIIVASTLAVLILVLCSLSLEGDLRM